MQFSIRVHAQSEQCLFWGVGVLLWLGLSLTVNIEGAYQPKGTCAV